jgi:alanyl-tRNA synthetase
MEKNIEKNQNMRLIWMVWIMQLVAVMLLPHRVHTFRLTSRTVQRKCSSPSSSHQRFASRLFSTHPEWTTDQVRSTFIEYFERKRNHSFVPSSPCAPLNDPSLLFTNAGMNQFKPIFLGQAEPGTYLASLQRACNSQKCIRAGGKHNDLEDVGRDTYHHTFFEMLGSWSFADYFKKEAIDYAWELLTQVYGLDPDRLYATYFQGDEKVPADLQAKEYWMQYLPEHRVIACNAKDNFWEMGETGPCGPCTEIHYDRIGDRDAAHLVNADDPNVIEIWNIVFIQYNRESETKLQTLPAQHVDTGMGLERLVSILQQKNSNYDIDCFQPIFQRIQSHHSIVGDYAGRVGPEDATLKDTAYRAIADHIRTLCFAIADGAIPNNEGRGYVLRRILRRAARYGQQILGAKSGFLEDLVPVVVQTFGQHYPELKRNEEMILDIIREEEQSFSSMLERGIKYFNELRLDMESNKTKVLPGQKAFFLYDTVGFPIDLTQLMANEAGLTVNIEEFEQEMKRQKQRSRDAQKAARADGTPDLELIAEHTAALVEMGVLPTDDGFKYKWDVVLPATVMAIFSTGGFVSTGGAVGEGDFVGLVLDKSSFYAEAGGQQADCGVIEILDDCGSFQVTDVQVYGGFVLHKGVLESGNIRVGSHIHCRVDYHRRRLIAPNHSMTHVLNAALRKVLGDKVDQRGSLCSDEKLRFDFSHKKALTAHELKQVEELCQNAIARAEPVQDVTLPLEEARMIEGVRPVFGEVYPDPVRVIRIGEDTSIEFCGGTHLDNIADAGAFVITEETSVAKGVRRVTAVTKDMALEAEQLGNMFQQRVTEIENVNANADGLDKRAGLLRKELDAATISASLKLELRARIETIQKEAGVLRKQALQKRVDSCLNLVRDQVSEALSSKRGYLVLNLDIGADAKASQKVLNLVRSLAPDMAFLAVSEEEPGSGGKLIVFGIVPDSKVKYLKADEWVREALSICGGRGGGKPGSAQGQAVKCDNVAAVEEVAYAFAQSNIEAEINQKKLH